MKKRGVVFRVFFFALFGIAAGGIFAWFISLKVQGGGLAAEVEQLKLTDQSMAGLASEKARLVSAIGETHETEAKQFRDITKACFAIDPKSVSELGLEYPIFEPCRILDGVEIRFFVPKGKHVLNVEPRLTVPADSRMLSTEGDLAFELPPQSFGSLRLKLANHGEKCIGTLQFLGSNKEVLQTSSFACPSRELKSQDMGRMGNSYLRLSSPDWYYTSLFHLSQPPLNCLEVKFSYTVESPEFIHALDILPRLKDLENRGVGTSDPVKKFGELFETLDENGRYYLKPGAYEYLRQW